ncbi:AAA family ATPase [Streptomyces decoyicus]|uniref:AAA family ATPase n=1 Tax=Streptomyces decoyicus TaxID=249567 RepID=UPI002E179F56
MSTTKVLVICGPAGVGKSSTAYEIARRLTELNVSHALIDSDELDRVHPWPPAGQEPSKLARRNLTALWANFAALGHTRLLITGVFTTLSSELSWISDAVPNADITSIRLIADLPTLKARIYRREIGSGAGDQLRRTIQQLDQMRQSDQADTEVIDTSDQHVSGTANRIINAWLGKPITQP